MAVNTTSTNSSPGGISVDWAALRDFAARSEAYEAEFGIPAPLTTNQRDAINILLAPVAKLSEQAKDFNFIGCLNEWLQKRALGTPDFEVYQVTFTGKNPPIYWRCTCELPSKASPFVDFLVLPREGLGADPSGQLPMFQRKQDAKAFAAKITCLHLSSKGHLSLPVGLTLEKEQAQPSVAPAGASAPSNTAPAPARKDTIAAPSVKPEPKPAITDALESSLAAADDVPIKRKISDLAKQLSLPAPLFRTKQEPSLGFWKGECDFHFNPGVPPGLGTVTGASSEKEAKRMMAEAVFSWMQEEEKRRAEIAQEFLGEELETNGASVA